MRVDQRHRVRRSRVFCQIAVHRGYAALEGRLDLRGNHVLPRGWRVKLPGEHGFEGDAVDHLFPRGILLHEEDVQAGIPEIAGIFLVRIDQSEDGPQPAVFVEKIDVQENPRKFGSFVSTIHWIG